MGGFDDVESHSPTRYSSMLGRGVGEARRRIVLVGLLALFLLLTLVAFRRQDTIKDVVSKGLHRTANATTSLPKPDTQTDLKENTEPKDTTASEKFTSNPSSKPAVIYKSPVLGNGERSLTQESLEDLHNSSLGVCRVSHPCDWNLLLTMLLTHSSGKFSYSMCLHEAINLMQ